MKTLTRKYAGLVVLTALLGMPLAYAAANETVDEIQEVVTDTWITSKVKSVFLTDTNIDGTAIHVMTNDGVVTLTGEVPTAANRDLAIRTAQAIKGVKSVMADDLTTSR